MQVEQIMQGEALAVFSSTVSAIAWALEVQATMAKHSWSQEVLAHEHCEVGVVGGWVSRQHLQEPGLLLCTDTGVELLIFCLQLLTLKHLR